MRNDAIRAETASLSPPTSLNRREIIVTSLATGFALAVQPVSAQTITTDAAGLTAGEVQIPVQGGALPAYRAMPASGRPFPTVIVVQEIFGVHEHIKDLCRRLAKAGYLAIAPEMFARQGDPSKITDIQQVMGQIVSKVPDEQVMSDLDATVAWAQASRSGDTSKLAITGFCWGGRVVWLYATHNPNLKAGVAWYGRLSGAPAALQPKSPLDVVADIKAPVLGLYGGKDQGIPLPDVEKMRAALKAGGANSAASRSEIVVYDEAPHGFNADYRPSYREKDAKDGWSRLLKFFKKNGVA